MKKLFVILAASLLALCLTSCKKLDPNRPFREDVVSVCANYLNKTTAEVVDLMMTDWEKGTIAIAGETFIICTTLNEKIQCQFEDNRVFKAYYERSFEGWSRAQMHGIAQILCTDVNNFYDKTNPSTYNRGVVALEGEAYPIACTTHAEFLDYVKNNKDKVRQTEEEWGSYGFFENCQKKWSVTYDAAGKYSNCYFSLDTGKQ